MRQYRKTFACILIVAFTFSASFTYGALLPPTEETTIPGELAFSLRYRFETYETRRNNSIRDAYANTAKFRMKFRSPIENDLRALIEFDHVAFLDEQKFSSAAIPKDSYPAIHDSKGSDLNQFYIQYEGFDLLSFQVGRQTMNWDNGRFIGSHAWRLNEQSFDGLSYQFKQDDIHYRYAFIRNVQTIYGPNPTDFPEEENIRGENHFFNASYDGLRWGKLIAYAYIINPEEEIRNASAHSTAGLSIEGSYYFGKKILNYRVELAQQNAKNKNPDDYRANYHHLTLEWSHRNISFVFDRELLGSDEDFNHAFQTPYADPHPFNGLADQFTTTPDEGLIDTHIAISNSENDSLVNFQYHQFKAEKGPLRYGNELDLSFEKDLKLGPRLILSLAEFRSANFKKVDNARRISIGAELSF